MRTVGTIRISQPCLDTCEPRCECRRYDGFELNLDEITPATADLPPWHRGCYCTIEVRYMRGD